MSAAADRRLVEPGDPLPPLPGHSSRGRLERVLRAGRFAVTSELNPPDSADPREVYDRAVVLSEVCDAINAVDASGAHVHMSSVGICALLTRAGYAVVMQIACRDKNRIAIQGDVLGAAAMGVANILCLTGDGVQCGDQPEAKPVFDLDSIGLLDTVRTMRDEGRFLSGRKLSSPPQVFLGAAVNPFVPPLDYRPIHLAKKIAAGAQFVQTQYCYDVPLLQRFMARVREQGLHEKCFILVGVGPLASARTARWMRSSVPGVHIPDEIVDRIEQAGTPKEQKALGKQLCVELIQEIREIPGVHGVHLMAYRQEEFVSEIIQASGVLQGRSRRARAPAAAGGAGT
ncbi:MAG: methylenetetrahydrofolate reductase [Geminicoccaceae bacterium]